MSAPPPNRAPPPQSPQSPQRGQQRPLPAARITVEGGGAPRGAEISPHPPRCWRSCGAAAWGRGEREEEEKQEGRMPRPCEKGGQGFREVADRRQPRWD